MGATSSKPSSVTSRNSPPSDFPSIAPSSMLSPTSRPRLSPIRSIPCRQSRSRPLSHKKPVTRVIVVPAPRGEESRKPADIVVVHDLDGLGHIAEDPCAIMRTPIHRIDRDGKAQRIHDVND